MRHLWWLVGLALVVGGTALAVTARLQPTDFGWFAYTPVEDADWTMAWGDGAPSSSGGAWFVVLSRRHVVGVLVAALGVLLLAAGAGYLAGRRRRPPPAV